LQKLNPVVMDASKHQACLPNTRVALLQFIQNWAVDPQSEHKLLWLHGLAGSGKSTIATTVANYFRQSGHLGAFLFFDRDVAERSDPLSVIRTLVYQLGVSYPEIGTAVCAAIDSTPTLPSSPINFQFQGLLLDVLATTSTVDTNASIVVILDALDECGTAGERNDLLEILAQESTKLPSAIRVIVTSRDDFGICQAFESQRHVLMHELDITSDANSSDVLSYFYHRLTMIRAQNRYLGLPSDWPGPLRTALLAKMACGLFVWASTASAFIEDGYDPEERLHRVLQSHKASESESALDALYATALQSAGKWDDESFRSDFSDIFGTIVAAKNPLSSRAIDQLLCPRRPSLHIISRFGCVLRWATGDSVRIVHPSFAEFLTHRDRCANTLWFIDVSLHHRRLAYACLDKLEKVLKRNIGGLSLSSRHIKGCFPEYISYATTAWIHHACAVTDDLALVLECMDSFMHHHLLHWLEAMSILKIPRDAISLLKYLHDWVQVIIYPIS